MKKYFKLGLVLMVIMALLASFALAKSKKRHTGGWIGIYMQSIDEDLAEAFDLPIDRGIIVNDVIEDSPADEAGLKSEDIIIRFGGEKIYESEDITELLEDFESGDKIELTILRDGDKMNLDLVLGERRNDYNWSFNVPKAPKAPRALRAPRAPRAPRASSIITIPDMPHIARIFEDGNNSYSYSYRNNSGSYIGVSLIGISKQLGDFFSVKKGRGALISEVEEDSPAEDAGLKAGDVIVSVDGEKIADPGDVSELVSEFDEGDEIKVVVVRSGSKETITIEVGQREGNSNHNYSFFGNLDGHDGMNFHFDMDDFPKMKGLYKGRHSDDDDAIFYNEEFKEAMQEFQEEMKILKEQDFKELEREMKRLKKELKEIRLQLD